MDNSETYIKMCEKAEEIQARRRLKEGDIIAWRHNPSNKNSKNFYLTWSEYTIEAITAFNANKRVKQLREADLSQVMAGFMYPHLEITWLPRQDELQEMIQRSDEYARPFVARFAKWVHDEIDYVLMQSLKSMEQLWLAFVMKERYLKIWNGEEWVKV